MMRDLVAVRCRDVQWDNHARRITGLPAGGTLTVTGMVRGNDAQMRALRKLEEKAVTGWAGQLRQLGAETVVVLTVDSFVELMAHLVGGEDDNG